MSKFQDKIFQKLSDLERRVSTMVVQGTVHEVKGDKMRMVMGKDADGEPILSPWLNTSNQRGGAREGRFYKQGQNVTMLNPTGDPSQGVIMPYAPNKDFKRPDHASSSGQNEETYQQEDLRVKKTKDGYDIWLEASQQQGQGSGGQQSGQSGGGQESQGSSGGQNARMKIRLNNNGGITCRVGNGANAMRFSSTSEGVKLKAGTENWLVVKKDKTIWKMPAEVGDDPLPDDDA